MDWLNGSWPLPDAVALAVLGLLLVVEGLTALYVKRNSDRIPALQDEVVKHFSLRVDAREAGDYDEAARHRENERAAGRRLLAARRGIGRAVAVSIAAGLCLAALVAPVLLEAAGLMQV